MATLGAVCLLCAAIAHIVAQTLLYLPSHLHRQRSQIQEYVTGKVFCCCFTVCCTLLKYFIYAYVQTINYVLRCPMCGSSCGYGLYIHQFDAGDGNCCYFSCVQCISKLRTQVGVPADCWQRWDAKKINEYSQGSWVTSAALTRSLMHKATKKRSQTKQQKKKRKRKRSQTSIPPPSAGSGDCIQNIHSRIATIESHLLAIKSVLASMHQS